MPKAPCICDAGQAGVDFTVLQIIECVGVICQNHSRVREGMAALSIFCGRDAVNHSWLPARTPTGHPAQSSVIALFVYYPASFEEKGPNFGHFAANLTCLKAFIQVSF